MSVSSSSPPVTHLIPIDPRVYCETMNELHSYITTSKRGYLTQAELFRYYRQRHDNVEIPYRLLGYRSLLDLLSSDQRLFAIDLRREPAYIYSAVKLRQQKREGRRMIKYFPYLINRFHIIEGHTSFSRQHHSTNTLDDQHLIPPDYVFFDHHVPLNEQEQQQNIESADEQEPTMETPNERPLTPNNRNRFDKNVWHTPQLDEQIPLMDKKVHLEEESNEQTIQFVSNPFLPLPTVRLPSEINETTSYVKCESHFKPIQRRIISQDDDYDENKRPSIRDPTLLKFSSPRLNRSISTSTTSKQRMRDDEKKKLYENIKQEMRSLLISSPRTKYGGLSGSLLYSDYKQLNCGKEVPYVELGFHSFLALLRSMPDVVRIEHNPNLFSYRVHPIYNEKTAHIQKMVLEQRDKYEYQNQLYNQNWHSNTVSQPNRLIPLNFYHNNGQLPFLVNSLSYRTFHNVEENSPISFHRNYNTLLRRSVSHKLFISNEQQIEYPLQAYFPLTPSTPSDYQKSNEKINFQLIDRLPCASSTLINNDEICSTPDTFRETPPNFDIDDYRLNQSMEISNKNVPEENNNTFCMDNQINTNDDPLLPTSTNIISDNPLNSKRENSLISPSRSPSQNSIASCTNIKVFLPTIINETLPTNNEIFFEISHCNERKPSKIDENNNLIKRVNDAIRHCIHFRYIHRLYEVRFTYRHYPSSIETSSMKSQLAKIAFYEYKQELERFEQTSQLTSSIDDHKCQRLFDEYVSLQRNYYYMIKLMKKKQR